MKVKDTPLPLKLLQAVKFPVGDSVEQQRRHLRATLASIRYLGDLRQVAMQYGAHYLEVKRLRRQELIRFILQHHPVG